MLALIIQQVVIQILINGNNCLKYLSKKNMLLSLIWHIKVLPPEISIKIHWLYNSLLTTGLFQLCLPNHSLKVLDFTDKELVCSVLFVIVPNKPKLFNLKSKVLQEDLILILLYTELELSELS